MSATLSVTPGRLADDEVLSARDRLLDVDAVRDLFSAGLGRQGPLAVERVERVRAKYRPGESLRVLFRVWIGGAPRLVACRMRPDSAGLYQEALGTAVDCGPLRGVLHHSEWSTVFWTYPNDRRIKVEPERATAFAATRAGAAAVALEIAGFAPERAVIYRVTNVTHGGVAAYLKCYASGTAAAARRAVTQVEAARDLGGPALRIPRVLATDADMLLFEALPGLHLHDVPPHDLDRTIHALGQAMGALHALPPIDLPVVRPYATEALWSAGRLIAQVRPDVASLVWHLVARLVACRPPDADHVVSHGDLNARNWLTTGDCVALFDLDQASLGDPGDDLGSVLAWMRVRALSGAWTSVVEGALRERLLGGYGLVRNPPAERSCRWYAAAALLVDRAARAVTRVRGDLLALLPDVLVEAQREIDRMEVHHA